MPVKFWQRAAALAAWIVVWQLAAVSLGHGGLFLATPIQTLQALAQLAPTAGFWQRIVFSALRILAGFLLAVVGGLVLGALGARWRWVRIFIEPAMQLIRAMPVASFVILALLWVRSANLSVVVSFTHVLPVVYAGVQGGIADTDSQLLEMAHVYRLPLITRLRYIWLPGIFPSFCESCIAAMGMCWKSGVSAEVIGLPDHSVGDALYRAKITLSTPDVFAWTLVIVLLSALLSTVAARLLRAVKARLCPQLTAVDNLVLTGHGLTAAQARSDLRSLGFTEADLRLPAVRLSGGQKRRAALLRALLCQDAQTLLMDEPFTGMDADLVRDAAAVTRRLAGERPTILVTHDRTAAELLGWPIREI